MDKLSVVIITWDEEDNIRGCLESVKWADEIIIVDQQSSDKTRDIAREYTDKIFVVENKGTCEPDRMFAISKTTHDWVLYIDADERISDELREEIGSLLNGSINKFDGYYIYRKTFFLGRPIKGCGWFVKLVRLFKKGSLSFSGRVHQDGVLQGRAGYLKGHILHYSYRNLREYFEKFNRYTTLIAEEEYKKGIRINKDNILVFFILKPAYTMLRKYLIQKGFQEGFAGFFISFSAALGIFVSYAKVWEKQNIQGPPHLVDE